MPGEVHDGVAARRGRLDRADDSARLESTALECHPEQLVQASPLSAQHVRGVAACSRPHSLQVDQCGRLVSGGISKPRADAQQLRAEVVPGCTGDTSVAQRQTVIYQETGT